MKTVIITGAAGNLGTAVVQKFLDDGYYVVATVANEEQAKSFENKMNIEVHKVNLTSESDTASFIEDVIEKYHHIDGAMMLVGGFAAGTVDSTAGSDLKKQYSLNFETAYFVSRPLFNHMMNNGGGRLIFVGARPSIDAAAGKDFLAYALSKSLLFKLAEYLNATAKGKNVTASVIVPSTIDTPFNRKSNPGVNPQNWVKPEEIAEAMEFIISDKGRALREPVIKMYSNS